MDEMRFKQQEIDLLDLFWRLFEQWRGLVIAGIIFAALLASVMYFKSGKEAESVTAEITQETSTEDQYQLACTALSQYANYMLAKDSYSNSIFNKNDFKSCTHVSCTYQISLIDEVSDMYTLTNMYANISNDSTFLDNMVAAVGRYWEGVDPTSLFDIMGVSATQDIYSNNPRTGILTVSTSLPESADINDWERTLTKAINTYHSKISSLLGSHSVTPIFVNSKKMNDTNYIKSQNDKYTALITSKTAYDKTYASLGKEDQALVDQIISEGDGSYNIEDYIGSLDIKLEELKVQKAESEKKAAENVQPVVVERTFSPKYAALGFLLGVFLYACAYFMFFVFIRLVRGENELNNTIGTRNFGGVYEYPFNGAMARFMHDKRIYGFRTRKGKDIVIISDDIISKLEFIKMTQVMIISVGKASEKVNIITDEQVRYLNSHGISVQTLNIEDSAEKVRDSVFSDMDNVVIELIGNRTMWNNLYSVCSKLHEYKVNVIGSEYIEVG